MARQSRLVENRMKSQWRCSKHCCIYLRCFSCHLCNVLFWRVLFLSFVVLSCLDFPLVYVLLKMWFIVFYIKIYYVIVLFWLVLFRCFTEQTALVVSKTNLIDSVSLNFIDSAVIQIKNIIELNDYFIGDKWMSHRPSYQLDFFGTI